MSNITDSYARDLDLNLLRAFAVVAEEGSITRAASRLYVTQPAISSAMRRLTGFVGAELFSRQGRGVVLTSRGVELLAATKAHLIPLVSAAVASPEIDPRSSTATVRLGLVDGMGVVVASMLLELLRRAAPKLQLIIVPVQFRSVEELVLANKVDLALCVADALPRSIIRKPLVSGNRSLGGFACLYDPRFIRLPKAPTEDQYFACEHVVVSYAGDTRGIVEDATGKSRSVRVSVPSFSYVADVVDGSALVATLPFIFADHIRKSRPHLKTAPLPLSFKLAGASLDLLWSRATDDDAIARFVRGQVEKVVAALQTKAEPRRSKAKSSKGR